MSDLVVQFAVLWGVKLASGTEKERDELRQWDSEELLDLFTGWVEEYRESDYDDSVDFFEDKIEELLNGEEN